MDQFEGRKLYFVSKFPDCYDSICFFVFAVCFVLTKPAIEKSLSTTVWFWPHFLVSYWNNGTNFFVIYQITENKCKPSIRNSSLKKYLLYTENRTEIPVKLVSFLKILSFWQYQANNKLWYLYQRILLYPLFFLN